MSLYLEWCTLRITIAPGGYFDPRPEIIFYLIFFKVFIHLPIKTKYNECDPPEFGFYLYGEGKFFDSFWWCWRRKRHCFRMPWHWEWVRTSNLKVDGTWEHERPGDFKNFWEEKWKDIIWKETYPYTYKLNSGKIQERTATIKVEEREWRWRWFTWLPFPRIINKTISVDFNEEVGEGTGTWKGGTVGCGYKMKKAELPIHTLRRMEKERKFSR